MSDPERIGAILHRIFRGKRDQLAAEIREKFDPELSARLDHVQNLLDHFTGGSVRKDLSGGTLTPPGPASLSGGEKDEPFGSSD